MPEKTGEFLCRNHEGEWQVLLFNERYALKWLRGKEIRLVHSHVRLVLLAIVDGGGRGVVLGGAVGPPYASEIEIFTSSASCW